MNAPERLPIERPAIDGAVYLPNELLAPSPTQPRSDFPDAYISGMADSIKQLGVLQPILVRAIDGAKVGQPLYEIVDGECRWRGNKQAGEPTIPAIVKQLTDLEVMQIQLVSFLQRKDLGPLEEARGYHNMLRKPDGLHGFATADDLAKSIGKSRRYVFNRLKLLELLPEVQTELKSGALSPSVAQLIARLQPADQKEGLKLALQGWGGEPWTFRVAADEFERRFMLRLDKAPFKISDAELVASAGSCQACPKRTGANPDLFDDIKSADTCTDSKCYQLKVDTHHKNVLAKGKAEGLEVITGAQAKKVKPSEYGDLKGYLKLDEVNHRIDGSKPLEKLLGKDAPATVLLEDPHTHNVIKVVREEEAIAVLKKKGVIKQSRVPSTSADTRAAEAKARAATAWRTEAAKACAEAIAGPEVDQEAMSRFMWPEVAIWMIRSLGHDTGNRFCKLVEWENLTNYEQRVRDLTTAQLGQVLVAAVLAGDCHVNTYTTKPNEAPRIMRFAEQLGVDVAKIRRDLAAGSSPAKARKGQSTPSKNAAAQGTTSAAQTPEKALAEAVAKEKATAAAPAKKAVQKDNTAKLPATKAAAKKVPSVAKGTNQKDKAAAPPKATISSAAASPFPTFTTGDRVKRRVNPAAAWPFPQPVAGTVTVVSADGGTVKVQWDDRGAGVQSEHAVTELEKVRA